MEVLSKVRKLAFHTGNLIPQIGLGTYCLKGPDCIEGVTNAIKVGYRHIDTASIYKNEKDIAVALKKLYEEGVVKREDIFITSKINPQEQGYDNALKAIENMLQRLETDYLDLVIIHWPGVAGNKPGDAENAKVRLETWKALEEMKSGGKIRDIGVSNFQVRHLKHLLENSKTKPVLNQFELHPLCQDTDTIKFCQENNILVEAYSSLARNHENLMKNATMLSVAKTYGKTVAQVALKWAVQKDFIVLPKSKSEERIKENFNIFDFELTKEEIEEIDKLNQNFRTCWDPSSVTY